MNMLQYNLASVFLTMGRQHQMPKAYATNHFIASDDHANRMTLLSLVNDQYAVCTEPLEVLSMSRLYELTPLGVLHFEKIWKSIYKAADKTQCPQCDNPKAIRSELCGHCLLDRRETRVPHRKIAI